MYGHLEDNHKEFFIQKTSDYDKITQMDKRNDIDASELTNDKKLDDMWAYTVQIDMLPSYIRPSLANKILTIGQTIIMFGNDPRQKKGNFMKNKCLIY